jgi:hypothetical protein
MTAGGAGGSCFVADSPGFFAAIFRLIDNIVAKLGAGGLVFDDAIIMI